MVIVLLGLTATRSTLLVEAAILASALAWTGAECDWFGARPAVSSLIRGGVLAICAATTTVQGTSANRCRVQPKRKSSPARMNAGNVIKLNNL